MTDLFKKSISLLTRRQTNILSAAYIIMATVIFSQLLGLVRNRLLISIFGASNTLGIYNYALILPDTIFQLIIAAALASAFIPVFTQHLTRGEAKEAHKMASNMLVLGLIFYAVVSLVLGIFAPFFLQLFNLGSNFTPDQMILMANLMRIIIVGQLFFIVASFFTALLQSYNQFFIPGLAAAMYNLGIIIGILIFRPFGIYAAALGTIVGGIIFILVQLPLARKIGFSFHADLSHLFDASMKKVAKLMWPRTIQVGIQQIGTVAIAMIIGFMTDPGRMNLLFDYAKILMFAPVSLIGFSIAQAAFPVLSREGNNMEEFKQTFLSSAYQLLYLILPVAMLLLVLRIPIVRLIYGADRFDWEATILTGHTLAFLSLSIFAQALIGLYYRAFYALHNSVVPLLTSIAGTLCLILLGYALVVSQKMGIPAIALSFSIANIFQLIVLFFLLDKKTGGMDKRNISISLSKLFFAVMVMGFAMYIPIKLLDQLVFDTTRTVNLILLTGIASAAGLALYLFCTWALNIKEAHTYILLFKRIGNWKEVLYKSDEVIEATRTNP